jgi:hypothetical protein
MDRNAGERLVGRPPVRRREHFDLVARRAQPLEQLDQPRHDHVVRGAREGRDNVEDSHGGSQSYDFPAVSADGSFRFHTIPARGTADR